MKIEWAAALILSFAPLAAQADVADQSAAGFEIRYVTNLNAPQAKVRAAVLDVGRWWSGDHSYSGDAKNLTIDPATGCFCETLTDGQVRHMTVVYSDDGALRLFGGLGDLWAQPVDFVLGEQVSRLKRYVETGKPD